MNRLKCFSPWLLLVLKLNVSNLFFKNRKRMQERKDLSRKLGTLQNQLRVLTMSCRVIDLEELSEAEWVWTRSYQCWVTLSLYMRGGVEKAGNRPLPEHWSMKKRVLLIIGRPILSPSPRQLGIVHWYQRLLLPSINTVEIVHLVD